MNEYKVRFTDRIKHDANVLINEEARCGFHPIQISYSTGFGGHGLVILFERVKCDTE